MPRAVIAVHALDRDVPAGKVLLAEYGQIDNTQPRPVETVLQERQRWDGRTAVRLVARTAGWSVAGAVLRWDNGCFGVFWNVNGCRHGGAYRTLGEAEAHFSRLPA